MTPFIKFILKYPSTVTPDGVWRCDHSSVTDCICMTCPNHIRPLDKCSKLTEDEFNYLRINHPELFI